MKKLTWSELAAIGVGILATCFVISYLAKCRFNIETDFLSASAAFFAALVAMLLYSDWREEYLINELKVQNKNIHEHSRLFSTCIGDLNDFKKGMFSEIKVDWVFSRVKEGLSSSYDALSQYDTFMEMLQKVDTQEQTKNIDDLMSKIFPLIVTADIKTENNDESKINFLLKNYQSLVVISRDFNKFSRRDTKKVFTLLFNK